MNSRIPILFVTVKDAEPESWEDTALQTDGTYEIERNNVKVKLRRLGTSVPMDRDLWCAICLEGDARKIWRYLKNSPRVSNGPWTRHTAPTAVKDFIKDLRQDGTTKTMWLIHGDDPTYLDSLDYVENTDEADDEIIEI